MPDEPETPRRPLRFKPTEFEVVNERTSPPATEAEARPDPGPSANESGKVDLRDILQDAVRGVPVTGVHRECDRDNEVRGVMRAEQARQEKAGLFETGPLDDSKRRRQLRRFWILIGTLNLTGGTVAFRAGPGDPLVFTLAIAAMGAFSATLTWRTFFLRTYYDE
ncbi:MAG: hypothetical protein ACKOTE_01775 [Opitutaceae bacterium]